MINPIYNVPISPIVPQTSAPQPGAAEGPASFKNFLLDSIREVNTMQRDADQAVEQLMTGGETTPAEVLTAVQKADIAFRLMIQVRNKMVQFYDEVKNLRV